MGAWGVGIFENDDALDWLYEFERDGKAAIAAAFASVEITDYIDAPEASMALGAIEAVASALGKPAETLPEACLAALKIHGQAVQQDESLRARAPAVL